MELPYISGDVNPKRLLIFQDVTFRAQKMKKKKNTLKKFVTFQEMERFNHKLKKLLIFQEELPGPGNQKLSFCSMVFIVIPELAINTIEQKDTVFYQIDLLL